MPIKIIHRDYPEGYDYTEMVTTTDEAMSVIKKSGCISATINELMALGEEYPGLQFEYEIAALGTYYSLFTQGEGEGLYVPVLSTDEKGKPVTILKPLHSYEDEWDWYRFAAVPLPL